MLYLGIDQHARPITISLRDEDGDVLQARQVSTRPEKINAFFVHLTRERLREVPPFSVPGVMRVTVGLKLQERSLNLGCAANAEGVW